MRETRVYSTRDQLEDLKQSTPWRDIVRELSLWKRSFKDEAVAIPDDAADGNMSSASALMHLGSINGRIKAVDYLLSLPDIFISILEDKKDDTRRDTTD